MEDGWPVARAAERFQLSRTTAYRWLGRYQQAGRAGLVDRSGRPHRMPRLTPAPVVRKIVHLRTTRRWGPVQIGARLGLAGSTVHRVLVRVGRNRLAWTDRASGLPVRRYEHPAPGCLVHVDVKKLGNIPQGGGHRVHGRQLGKRHRQADKAPVRAHSRHPQHGYGYVHAEVGQARAGVGGPGRPGRHDGGQQYLPDRVAARVGRVETFLEIDRMEWFTLSKACRTLKAAQVPSRPSRPRQDQDLRYGQGRTGRGAHRVDRPAE